MSKFPDWSGPEEDRELQDDMHFGWAMVVWMAIGLLVLGSGLATVIRGAYHYVIGRGG